MNGIIPLWKPRGLTSADCVYKMRKILKTKKIGHTGTLDPDVNGVLPLCVGSGTKLVEYLVDSDKVYEADITFGSATTTEDASGEIVESKTVEKNDITEEDLETIFEQFIGTIIQVPPMYSAVKVDGKRLYDYARMGESVERPQRQVDIYTIDRLSEVVYDDESKSSTVSVKIRCGKGTYIRTLAVDIGKALGFPAHMSQLQRTSSGGIQADETFTFEEIERAMEEEKIDDIMLSLPHVFKRFPQVELNDDLYNRVKNGAILMKENFSENLTYPVSFTYDGELIAIYQTYQKNTALVKPQKIINVNR